MNLFLYPQICDFYVRYLSISSFTFINYILSLSFKFVLIVFYRHSISLLMLSIIFIAIIIVMLTSSPLGVLKV